MMRMMRTISAGSVFDVPRIHSHLPVLDLFPYLLCNNCKTFISYSLHSKQVSRETRKGRRITAGATKIRVDKGTKERREKSGREGEAERERGGADM